MEKLQTIKRAKSNFTYLYVITSLEQNNFTNRFKVSFRTYEHRGDFGGFETTLFVKNCSVEKAMNFVGDVNDWNQAAKENSAEIFSKKVNNVVPSKYSFNGIKKLI